MGILVSEVAILASVSMPNAHLYRALDEGHKTQIKFCALKDNADYILAPKNPDLRTRWPVLCIHGGGTPNTVTTYCFV